MAALHMWCSWPVFPLLLLLSIVPMLAEVVNSMSDCDHFLLEETPPQIPGVLEGGKILNQNRYKPICQTYRNKRRFVTLYDIKNKIPVYSAYKYRGVEGKGRPKKHWKIEPQLENELANKNMMGKDKQTSYNHQAVDTDFRSNGMFDRGHIIPSSYASTENDKRSTFTLTNIVPQAGSFNKGSWSRMESCIRCVMDKYCTNSSGFTEGFVVTGAQPSFSNILNNKVNIPSMLWTAFCCYSTNMEVWIASAHWGNNVPDGAKNKHLQTKTLAELHDLLRTKDSEFTVFPGAQCPLYTTVAEFYPQGNKCHCPPSGSSALHSSTSGPHSSTSTPQTSTSASYSSTAALQTSTSAPHSSTSAPKPSTSASNSSTFTTQTSTSAPHSSTFTTQTSTSASYSSTSASQTSTSSPHSSTSVSQTSTSASFSSTSAAQTSTSAPHSSTFTTHTSTSASYSSTSASQTSTSSPHSSTSVSQTSTSASFSSTSATQTSTSSPHSSTSTPQTSISQSYSSTFACQTATSAPHSSRAVPQSSTLSPYTSTTGPHTTSVPLTYTSVCLTATSTPQTATSSPQTLTAALTISTSVS